jgi:ABC-type uncharacterized transport system ATPase component
MGQVVADIQQQQQQNMQQMDALFQHFNIRPPY